MVNKERFYRIPFTFGIDNVDRNIETFTKTNEVGYVCVVDINVLANSYTDNTYLKILQKATFNTCDGSFLAFLLNIKYKRRYKSYNGPEIFEKFIVKSEFEQLLIGPSHNDFNLLKSKIDTSKHIHNLELPFKNVNEFDYLKISKHINDIKPNLIWVMLGAPKQEKFINNLIPYVNSGLLFGTGAALNFYLGRINNRQFNIIGLRFIWLERIFLEPRKQLSRIFKFLKVLNKIIRDA